MLSVDHTILKNGGAYTNSSGLFYSISGSMYGLNAYSTPFRQLVNDASISGATVMSGVYVSGVFVQPGQSGLVSLNVSEGTAYFSWRPGNVSGIFGIKEINVYLSNEPEQNLLFETKMTLKTKYPQTITGLTSNQQTFPVVFIKPIDSQNVPFCFGSDNKIIKLRAVVLAETQYQLYAVCNILENMAHNKIPLIDVQNLPFDAIGGFKGESYDYEKAISGVSNSIYINSAKTSMLMSSQDLNKLNPAIFPAFVDFELWNI